MAFAGVAAHPFERPGAYGYGVPETTRIPLSGFEARGPVGPSAGGVMIPGEMVRLGAFPYEYAAAGLGDLGDLGQDWWPTSWRGWLVPIVIGAALGAAVSYLAAE